MGGSGLDRNDDSQKFCRTGLNRTDYSKKLRIRTGSDSISADQDWIRTTNVKVHSYLAPESEQKKDS